MRQIHYKWLGKQWTLDIHPPGDSVCDMFQPPQPMEILSWFLADRNGTFVDVGGHIGTFAIHAAPFFRKVVAFEPEARNLGCLRKNVAQNSLPNVTIIPKAVSDQCGVSTFYILDCVDTGRNSLLPTSGGASVEVEMVSIDSVFSAELAEHPPITYMKVDIEGFEPKAIRGSAGTLARQNARPIMKVEFTPAKWVKNEDDFYWLCDFLKKNSYIPFFPTSGFVSPLTVDTLMQLYESWKGLIYDSWVDVIFIPKEQSSQEQIIAAWRQAALIFSQMGPGTPVTVKG